MFKIKCKLNEMLFTEKGLREDAKQMTSSQIKSYLDDWYKKVPANKLLETLESQKKSWLWRMDYYATMPFITELCSRNDPYKGVKEACGTFKKSRKKRDKLISKVKKSLRKSRKSKQRLRKSRKS